MDNNLLIILLISISATIFFTLISILLLIFPLSHTTIAEETDNHHLFEERIRKREVAMKAAEVYQRLQEEDSDLKIIVDYEDQGETNPPSLARYHHRKRLNQREKIVV